MTSLYMYDGSQGGHGQDRTIVDFNILKKDRKNYVDIMYINTCSQINPKFYRGTIIVNLNPSLGKLFFY